MWLKSCPREDASAPWTLCCVQICNICLLIQLVLLWSALSPFSRLAGRQRPAWNWQVGGSIPGWVFPKTVKMVPLPPCLELSIHELKGGFESPSDYWQLHGGCPRSGDHWGNAEFLFLWDVTTTGTSLFNFLTIDTSATYSLRKVNLSWIANSKWSVRRCKCSECDPAAENKRMNGCCWCFHNILSLEGRGCGLIETCEMMSLTPHTWDFGVFGQCIEKNKKSVFVWGNCCCEIFLFVCWAVSGLTATWHLTLCTWTHDAWWAGNQCCVTV